MEVLVFWVYAFVGQLDVLVLPVLIACGFIRPWWGAVLAGMAYRSVLVFLFPQPFSVIVGAGIVTLMVWGIRRLLHRVVAAKTPGRYPS